jgi:hypothetical protein
MEKATLLVISSSKEGLDEEFNRFCNDYHLGEVVACDGYVRGSRYSVVREMGNASIPGQYVSIYEIESDDVARDQAKIDAMRARGEMTRSDAVGSIVSVTLLRHIKTVSR